MICRIIMISESIIQVQVVPSFHTVRQPLNSVLSGRTKSNPMNISGFGLQHKSVWVFGEGGVYSMPLLTFMLSCTAKPYQRPCCLYLLNTNNRAPDKAIFFVCSFVPSFLRL